MPSRSLPEHIARGVIVNACSLHQLEMVGRVAPGQAVAVRVNAGLGSGSTKRTNTGRPASSFGIWREYLGEVKAIAARHRLTIRTLHSHIGPEAAPEGVVAAGVQDDDVDAVLRRLHTGQQPIPYPRAPG